MSQAPFSSPEHGPEIVRREQSVRSRQYRGVLTRVIYESESLEVLRTEIETGSVCNSEEFGDFSAVHFVIEGNPVFRAAGTASDLMPGDSIIFDRERPYVIIGGAPSRSVILSILFRAFAMGNRP